MKERKYKYQSEYKLDIYKEPSFNKSKYKDRIENAKPRYMNEYLNTPKFNRKGNEKSFNNLLNNYYSDFEKLKNKYNFVENDEYADDYPEEDNNNLNFEKFQEKKIYLNDLFISYEMPDIEDINFDLTDYLINNLDKGKNDTILKNTQINTDYNLRLKEGNKMAKGNYFYPNENKTESNEENIMEKLDEQNQKDNEEEEQNLKGKKGKNNKNIIREKSDENEDKIEKEENSKSNDNFEEDEINYLNDENQENNNSHYLKLKYNEFDELHKFEDIINSNFNKQYEIPMYEIPESEGNENEKEKGIEKNDDEDSDKYNDFYRNKSDDEEEQKDKKEKDKSNKEEKPINTDSKGEIKMLDDIIKDKEEENPKVEDIINGDKKIIYNPPENFPNTLNEEKQSKNMRFPEDDNGEFSSKVVKKDETEIKKDTVENILKNNNDEDKIDKDIDKNNLDNEDKEKEKTKDNEFPTVEKMINKHYEEDKIVEAKEGKNKKLKESINNNDSNSDRIVVDDLNDDNEDDYGGFEKNI